ncbi:MAG: uncharacterized protein A8A55_2075 [Amphiamblys sp. WSBS2006]|nr:MAG: uncharacterized protein A8A55_2075 [Amphiamblys sp. WSBS2006]
MDEYKKAIGQNEEGLSALIIPDSFSLTQDLPNETLLLTEKTTVTLDNIEMSEKLFFILLEKTKVVIGERVSITEHVDGEDCIREHDMAIRSPFCLERRWAVSDLTRENIERMAPNSIGCSLRNVRFYNTGFINILPKLRIHEDCEVKTLVVSTTEEEHVAAILTQDQPICVGSMESMSLDGYAVSILTKMRNHKNSMVEKLALYADEEEHIAEILAQDQPVCVGRVRDMAFRDYAVGVLPKLIHEDWGVEYLSLSARKEEHVAAILSQGQPLCVGRMRSMNLDGYAVCVLPKLEIHGDHEMEFLRLYAYEKEHVAAILAQDQPVCAGRAKSIALEEYAVGILPKLIHEDWGVKSLRLNASKEEHVAAILTQKQAVYLGSVKEMEFRDYAVFVFLKIKKTREVPEGLVLSIDGDELWRKIHGELKEENTVICIEEVEKLYLGDYAVNILPALKTKRGMETFVLSAKDEDQVSEVLAEEYKGISFGGIKGFGLYGSAVNLLPKLRIHEDNTMERFVLAASEAELSRILEEGDSSIEVGRIKQGGFDVPGEIRQKLRYILVEEVISEERRGEERRGEVISEEVISEEVISEKVISEEVISEEVISEERRGEVISEERRGEEASDREAAAVGNGEVNEVFEERNREKAAVGDGEVGETVEEEVSEERRGEEASDREAAAVGDGEAGETVYGEINEVAEKEPKKKAEDEQNFFLRNKTVIIVLFLVVIVFFVLLAWRKIFHRNNLE